MFKMTCSNCDTIDHFVSVPLEWRCDACDHMNGYSNKDLINKTNDAGEKLQSIEEIPTFEEHLANNVPIKNVTPKYYGAKCKCGGKMDPYVVCDAYENIKASAHHHAVKKLLRAGEGHKALHQDVQEVIDTLTRWQEQLVVDELQKT